MLEDSYNRQIRFQETILNLLALARSEDLKKHLDRYTELLFPEMVHQKKSRLDEFIEKAKKMLGIEDDKGG
jgi:hypothetical protein